MASLDLGALSYTLKLNREGFTEGINQTKSDMKGLSDGVKTADEANKVFQSNMKNFQSSLQATGVSFENLDQKLRLWAANNKESIGSVEANSQVIETNKAKMAELASQLSKVETVLRETKTIFGENSTEYKKVENSVIELEISYGKLEEENRRLIASNKEMEASANPSFFEELKTNVSSVGEATERLGSKGISVSGILGKAFGSIKSVVMNTAVPIMAGMGLQSLIDKSKAGQQAVGQMNAVLTSTHGVAGMTKDALLNLAQSQSQVTTYSKGANIATENLLLTFTNIGKDVFPSALKAVNDMSTALGQDTKSSAIQLGKALNDPIGGITALSRVGVNFTEQQKQQIKTMVETGHTAEAQKSIVAELNKEFGGSAVQAGKSFDGQYQIVKNQIFGIGAAITSQLMPAITSLMSTINSHIPQIQSVVSSVISGVTTSFKTLGPILLGIGQDVGKIATEVFPQMDSSGSNLGKTILSLTKGALTDLKGVFDWLAQHGNVTRAAILGIGTAFAALKTASTVTNIFKAFTDGAAGVKTATGLVSNFGKAFSTLTKLPVALASGFGSLGTKAVSSIGLFSSGLGTLGSKLSALMVGPWKLLINGFKSLPGIIKNLSFTNIVTKLINPFKNMPTLLRGIFSKIPGTFGTFKTALTGLVSSVVSLGPKILSGIKSAFSIQGIMNGAKAALALFTSPWGALVLVIVAAVGAIIANWDSIKAWVTQHFGGTLPTSFKQFQQIFSQIWTTIQQVFTQVWNNIKNVVTQVWAYISPTIMGAVKQIQAFWNEVWPELKELFVEVWNVMKVVLAPAVSALYTIISTGIGLIKGIWGPAWNVLKDTLKTVWDAITGVIKVAWDIVSGVIKVGLDLLTGHWSKAWDDFKSIFSNTWNDLGKLISNIAKDALKWGSDIIDGIVKGIEGAAGGLKNSVGNVANTIRSYLHFSVPDEGPLKLAA